MPPSYKLIYFDWKGRAEGARYIFHLAGQEFEDYRVTKEEWKQLKPKTPLGQIPILEVDGKQLPQSHAIRRYLAEEFGFLGSSIWERAQINVVCETVKDFAPEISQFFAEKDETRKAELKKAYLTVGVYKHIGNLEKLLKQNNGGTGWFVGDKVSLADVEAFARVYDFISFLDGKEPGDFDLKDHPVFKGFIERFKSQPKIADWISKRPQTSL